jgi:hypothetical protein
LRNDVENVLERGKGWWREGNEKSVCAVGGLAGVEGESGN